MPNLFNLPEGQEPHLSRYIKFIQGRPIRDYQLGITHRHHILPKSMGGFNKKENIIVLTYREHYIAHLMLWKTYRGKMAKAFHIMTKQTGSESKLTSKQYDAICKDYGKASEGTGNPFYGKTHSEQARSKMQSFRKEYSYTQSHCRNISNSHKGQKNFQFGKTGEKAPTSKKVICIETGIIYGSLREASRLLGLTHPSLSRACHRPDYTYGGCHWKLLDYSYRGVDTTDELTIR